MMEKQLPFLEMSPSKKGVCLVDPFRNVCQVERMILEEYGLEVDSASTLEEGERLCFSKNYALILSEFFFPAEKTLDFLRRMKAQGHKPYLILSTSFFIDDATHQRLFQAGLDDLLFKPYGRETLEAHVQKGLERHEVILRNLSPPVSEAHPEPFGILERDYFTRTLRREIKKARRHQDRFSLILLKLPGRERLGTDFAGFYGELTALLRRSVREEDLIGRENGHIGIILEKTDERGSRILGERLVARIQAHPAFQKDPSFRSALTELNLSYYTFPAFQDMPPLIASLIEEIQKEEKTH